MALIQFDIPKELNDFISIQKIRRNCKDRQSVILEILEEAKNKIKN